MELSIIVTNYGNPELLRLCLDSIKKCASDVEHELIVADSETKEDTEMMMRESFPDVKFFPDEKNIGFMACAEKGIKHCTGKYILIMNGDIIVTPDSIQKMMETIKNDRTIGMIGPKLLSFNGKLQDSCFRFYQPVTIVYRRTFLGKLPFGKKHLDWFIMKDYDHKDPKEVDWLMGSVLMISREALEKVGFMDKRYFMYFEDVDWCRRFWENGFRVIYYPLASMHHYHGKGSAKGGVIKALLMNKYAWIHISSSLKYFKKFWGKPVPKHN